MVVEGEKAETIIIILQGECEVYQNMGSFEFLFERLYQGTVINLRSFILEDLNAVTIRVKHRVTTLQMNHEIFERVKNEHPVFGKQMNIYSHTMLKRNKKYPLDYYLHLHCNVKNGREEKEGILRRENIFKNVVCRILSEIRAVQNRQRQISETLQGIKKMDKQEKERAVEKMRMIFQNVFI